MYSVVSQTTRPTFNSSYNVNRAYFFILALASLLLLLVINDLAEAKVIAGRADVVDGDTLIIGNAKIRLNAIDAPETDQLCLDRSNKLFSCGVVARDRLSARIGSASVSCETEGTDRYGRFLAVCFLGGDDLNRWMVSQGLALAYIQYSNRYQAIEQIAKRDRKGLWAGAFIAPWDWRHRTPQTALLGAIAEKANAILISEISVRASPVTDCVIKGNVNRQGDRIYFLPGNSAYGKVKMDKGLGERWFCTEEEAEAAGWRKARN